MNAALHGWSALRPARHRARGTLRRLARALRLIATLACAAAATDAAAAGFNFGVIGWAANASASRDGGDGEAALHKALLDSDADNLAFVVVNGIKSAAEPCSDQVYLQRRNRLEQAQNGIVMSLAADDWTTCKNRQGKSAAIERLNQVRELFYDSDLSFGASKLDLIRQSATPKFREYVENARWEIDSVLFATVNLPAPNNHYRSDGGRNGEFEDRQIANRNWLQRLFAIAAGKRMPAIVLFCDVDPMLPGVPRGSGLRAQRDGLLEIRQQLTSLASKFSGRVLVIHAEKEPERQISWRGNLGTLAVEPGWTKVHIDTVQQTTPNTTQKIAMYRVAHR